MTDLHQPKQHTQTLVVGNKNPSCCVNREKSRHRRVPARPECTMGPPPGVSTPTKYKYEGQILIGAKIYEMRCMYTRVAASLLLRCLRRGERGGAERSQ